MFKSDIEITKKKKKNPKRFMASFSSIQLKFLPLHIIVSMQFLIGVNQTELSFHSFYIKWFNFFANVKTA